MENQIREAIIVYLAGEISLPDLQQFLIETTWDEEPGNARATALAYSAQLALAEHERGHRDGEELLDMLRRIASTAPLGEPVMEGFVTGSLSVTEEHPQLVVAGTRSAGARA